MTDSPDHLKSPEELAAERRSEEHTLVMRLVTTFGLIFLAAAVWVFVVSRDTGLPDDSHLIVEIDRNAEAEKRFFALAKVTEKFPPDDSRAYLDMLDRRVPWDREVAENALADAKPLLLFDELLAEGDLQFPPRLLATERRWDKANGAVLSAAWATGFQAMHQAECGDRSALLETARDLFGLERRLLERSPTFMSNLDTILRVRSMATKLVGVFVQSESGREELVGAFELLRGTEANIDPSLVMRREYTLFKQVFLAADAYRSRLVIGMGRIQTLPDAQWFYYQPNKTVGMRAEATDRVLAEFERPHHERTFPSEDARSNSVINYIRPNAFGKYLTTPGSTGAEFMADRIARAEATHRALLLLCALKLYASDHVELPRTLAELIPKYIPTVPLDPYSGKPMKYDPTERFVYSVGDDGVDGGGDRSQMWPASFQSNEPTFPLDLPPLPP